MSQEAWSVLGGWRATAAAEHAWADVAPADGVGLACTVLVPDRGEVAIFATGDERDLVDGARAFRYPGHEELHGVMTVAELTARSAIDAVVGLGAVPVSADDVVDTRSFVRPVVEDGRLVLRVRPARGGVLVPFEVPSPTPCCAEHA